MMHLVRSVPAATAGVFLFISCALTLSGCDGLLDAPAPSQGYAIVYGVSTYPHVNPLNQPDGDALAVAQMLKDAGYEIISGDARVNNQVTWANLDADITSVAADATADSRFVFYFAGHAYGDGDDPITANWADYVARVGSAGETPALEPLPEFLLFYDIDPSAPQATTTAGIAEDPAISDGELAAMLARIPSRQKIVILDACHSGGFATPSTSVDSVPWAYDGSATGISIFDGLNALTLFVKGPSASGDTAESEAIVLAASGEGEFSYEGTPFGLANGAFTSFLLETPYAADRNYDGLVTTSEAYAYVAAKLVALTDEPQYQVYRFLPRESGGAVDYVLFPTR